MITTRSYFWGNIQIANAEDTAPNSNLLGNSSLLQDFINKYERELLVRLFGIEMYTEFSAQFDVDPTTKEWTIKTSADQKWKDLLNGVTYDGKRWNGLIQDVEGSKTSFIANYVYCKFVEATGIEHAGVGFTVTESKNAIRVSGASLWANAWNEMVVRLQGNCSLYPWSDLYSKNDIPLFAYLNDKSDDFPDWQQPAYFEFKNRFGL